MFDWLKRQVKTPQSPPPLNTHPARETLTPSTPAGSQAEAVGQDGDYPVGAHIGHYRVLGNLGEGGMSRVYRVRFEGNGGDGAEYALKILLGDGDEELASRDRFLREIRISAALQHPNICRLVDWDFDVHNAPYIVMELLEGELLHHCIFRLAPMPVGMARSLVVQVLQGLVAIHEANIVHRDLKPGNIFVVRDGTVKIMDFGIARKAGLGSLTSTGLSIGTPQFIAPEQLVDMRHVDARADLFSLGLVFYHMLTGASPIQGASLPEIAIGLSQGVLTPIAVYRPDLPPGVAEWLSMLLKPRREDRFTSAQEALDAIRF